MSIHGYVFELEAKLAAALIRVKELEGQNTRQMVEFDRYRLAAVKLEDLQRKRIAELEALNTPLLARVAALELLLSARKAVLDVPCVCGHVLRDHAVRGGVLACTIGGCACAPGCIHEGFVAAVTGTPSANSAPFRQPEWPADPDANDARRACANDLAHGRDDT